MNLTRSQFLWLASGLSGLAQVPTSSSVRVDWRMLRGLNYRTGEATPELKAAAAKQAKVPGFMVPLEDEEEIVNEFLLVPYVGACIHTPPPPPNQIVYVMMENKKRVKLSFWDPVWVHGKLDITPTESPYGSVSFKMTGKVIEPYKE